MATTALIRSDSTSARVWTGIATGSYTRPEMSSQPNERVTVPTVNLIMFTRQFAIMLRSGVPLVPSLDTLSHQDDAPNFSTTIIEVARKVESGYRLSRALNDYPRVFDASYVSMVAVGEETGGLVNSLENLADWRERDFDVTRRVKKALTYPAFVVVVAAVMTLLMFYAVLPELFLVFEQMRIELPWITRCMMAVTETIKNPGSWLVMTTIVIYAVTAVREMLKTPATACRLFTYIYKVPLVGELVKFASTARFAGALSTMVASGLDLRKSLRLAGAASGSPLLERMAKKAVQGVIEGETLSEHFLAAPQVFPVAFGQFIMVGEETSRLEKMMSRVADLYNEEINYRIESLSAALEPLLLFVAASGAGAVLLATFLPLYSYLQNLGL